VISMEHVQSAHQDITARNVSHVQPGGMVRTVNNSVMVDANINAMERAGFA
jgi:hypothetical protein